MSVTSVWVTDCSALNSSPKPKRKRRTEQTQRGENSNQPMIPSNMRSTSETTGYDAGRQARCTRKPNKTGRAGCTKLEHARFTRILISEAGHSTRAPQSLLTSWFTTRPAVVHLQSHLPAATTGMCEDYGVIDPRHCSRQRSGLPTFSTKQACHQQRAQQLRDDRKKHYPTHPSPKTKAWGCSI